MNVRIILSAVAGITFGAIAVEGIHAQSKPPAYVITEANLTNNEAYLREYLPLVRKRSSFRRRFPDRDRPERANAGGRKVSAVRG